MNWIQNATTKIPAMKKLFPTGEPATQDSSKRPLGGGNQAERGTGSYYDVDETSPQFIVVHSLQALFPFINLCIYIAIAAFQRYWGVGPSFMTALALLVSVGSFLFGLMFLIVPLTYTKFNFLRGVARFLRQIRIGFILVATQVFFNFLLAIIATVSANSGGCKNRSADPNAGTAGYTAAMDPFCRNKRAAAAFFWPTLIVWSISLASILKTWYAVRTNPQSSAFLIPNDGDGTDTFIADTQQHQREMEQQDRYHAQSAPSNVAGGGYRASGDYYGADRIFGNERDPEGYRTGAVGGAAGGRGAGGEFVEAREVYRPRMEDPFDPPAPGWDRENALREADPYERIRQSMEVGSTPSGESRRY